MNVLLVSLITTNLFLGSTGPEVLSLQQALNRDPDTRIASAGVGSPGNETEYFGSLTKAAVVRFQEKYAEETLSPVGLTRGTGYVGLYTRTKLNALSSSVANTAGANNPVVTPSTPVLPQDDYLVKDSEKIDIYAGDKMLANIRNKILSSLNTAINSAAASRSTATITPATASATDVPSVVIGDLSPQSGLPGTRISIVGSGISSGSVVYFGSAYIVRTVSKDATGNYFFSVPPIPPGRYDAAIRSGNSTSNTEVFVITRLGGPSVHLQSVSPSTVAFGDTIVITGSGFHSRYNDVVTTYHTFTDIPSTDGKTLTLVFAPERLREVANIGDGSRTIPMFLYVVNEYGFSDTRKSFSMKI